MKIKNLQVIEEFIEKDDQVFIMSVLKQLEIDNKFNNWNGGRLLLINPEIPEIYTFLKKYSQRILDLYKDFFNYKLYLQEFFLAIFPEGASMKAHIDSDGTDRSFVISAVLYLNDDFTGGEIVFPNLNFEYKPKARSLVAFQGYGIEYLHEVKTLESGKRYTIPLVFTKDKQYEVNLNQVE